MDLLKYSETSLLKLQIIIFIKKHYTIRLFIFQLGNVVNETKKLTIHMNTYLNSFGSLENRILEEIRIINKRADDMVSSAVNG